MVKVVQAPNGGFEYNGFKLIKFELSDNKLFGNIVYEFIDKKDKQDKIYTTVLIGPNGTLKSRLFQKIILTFWALHDLQVGKKVKFTDKFYLKYSLGHSIYEFGNIERGKFHSLEPGVPYLRINNKPISNFEKVELPLSIIAIAIMITDRFPFPDIIKFPGYHYLGSRYRPQLASNKTFIGRVVEFISQNINSEAFILGVSKIVKEFLHNSNKPFITFNTQNTQRFFRDNLTIEEFYSYYEELDAKYQNKTTTPPFKLSHYKGKIRDDKELASRIFNYCNELKKEGLLRSLYKSTTKALSFSLLEENDIKRLREQFVLLDHMRQLGIIYPAQLEFLKTNKDQNKKEIDGYPIIESSSGEYNLLGSMIGIIASVQTNSLIFIDEPEISLHPNWQMKYLSFLRELLADKNYSTCHVIVATHSHFLISDLEGESSSVIKLTRDIDTKLVADSLDGQDTYCWSPDDVLYNVFGVTSSRNKFVAEDIANILDDLSKGNKDTINKIDNDRFNTLVHLEKTLKPNDPLRNVVISILKKIG